MLYRISLEWVALLYPGNCQGNNLVLAFNTQDGAKLNVFYERKTVVMVVVVAIIYLDVRHTKFFTHVYLILIISCCIG